MQTGKRSLVTHTLTGSVNNPRCNLFVRKASTSRVIDSAQIVSREERFASDVQWGSEQAAPSWSVETPVKLKKAEIDSLHTTFRFYDVDKTGGLDRDEVLYMLGDMGIPMDTEKQQKILEFAFNKFDEDGSGVLEIDEFANFLALFFQWQYIAAFESCHSFGEMPNGKQVIDAVDVHKLICELGLDASWEELQDTFSGQQDVEYSDFVQVLDNVRMDRISVHRKTAGFDDITLNSIQKHFNAQGGDKAGEISIMRVLNVIKALDRLPREPVQQQKLVDMLSAHERDGKQAKCMNWEETVQFVRCWFTEYARKDVTPVPDVELMRVQDMLEVSWCSRYHAMSRSEVATLMQYFHVHDYDASGCIEEAELSDLLVDCGLECMVPDVHRLMEEADENSDGTLDAIEFVGVLKNVYKLVYERAWQKVYNKRQGPLIILDFRALLLALKITDVNEAEIDRLMYVLNKNHRAKRGPRDEDGNYIMAFQSFLDTMDMVREIQMEHYRKHAGFTKDQIKEFRELFDTADTDHSGFIDPEERNHILTVLDKLPKNKQQQKRLVSLIHRIDRDNNNMFDFEEFLQLCRCWENEAVREQYAEDQAIGLELGFQEHEIQYMNKIFNDVDVDGDEKVVLSEMTTMFRRIGITLDPKNARRVDEWIREFSRDEYDIGVNFGGFLRVMKRVVQENIGGIMAPKPEVVKKKKIKKESE